MYSSKLENDFVNSGLKRGTRYWDFTTKYTMGGEFIGYALGNSFFVLLLTF